MSSDTKERRIPLPSEISKLFERQERIQEENKKKEDTRLVKVRKQQEGWKHLYKSFTEELLYVGEIEDSFHPEVRASVRKMAQVKHTAKRIRVCVKYDLYAFRYSEGFKAGKLCHFSFTPNDNLRFLLNKDGTTCAGKWERFTNYRMYQLPLDVEFDINMGPIPWDGTREELSEFGRIFHDVCLFKSPEHYEHWHYLRYRKTVHERAEDLRRKAYLRAVNGGSSHEALGVRPGASQAEIKAAYRKKAQENHPDKGGDKELFVKIKQAYNHLCSSTI